MLIYGPTWTVLAHLRISILEPDDLAEEYAGGRKDFLKVCAERMVNAANACAGHGRNGEGPPSIFQTSSQVRSWLKADIQPPEIEVRFAPKSGHSEANAGLPLLTQSRPCWLGLDRRRLAC